MKKTISYGNGDLIMVDHEKSPEEHIKQYFEREAISASMLKNAYPGAYQETRPEYNYKAALVGNLTEMLACFPAHAASLYTTADIDMSTHMAILIKSAVDQGAINATSKPPEWWMQEKDNLGVLGQIKKEDTLMKNIEASSFLFELLLDSRIPVKSADYVLSSAMANALQAYFDDVRSYFKAKWGANSLPTLHFQVAAYTQLGTVGDMPVNRGAKALFDILVLSHELNKAAVLDIKTTKRLVPEFLYDISAYRYDISAAWYKEIAKNILSPEFQTVEFGFIAVSKSSPSVPKLFMVSSALIELFMTGYRSLSGNYFPGLNEYINNYFNPIDTDSAKSPITITDLWNPSLLYTSEIEQPNTGTLFS